MNFPGTERENPNENREIDHNYFVIFLPTRWVCQFKKKNTMLTPLSTYSRLRPYMRKGDRSRRDMLDAARRLILTGGLEAASHAAIAGELTPSKGAVLYPFPTKQALWNGLIDEYANHLADDVVRFSQPFRDAGFTFEDSILPALYIWFIYDRERHPMWKEIGIVLMSLHHSDSSRLSPIGRFWYDAGERVLSSNLPRAEAYCTLMAFHGFFLSSMLGSIPMTPEKVTETMLAMVLELYGNRAEELRRLIESIDFDAIPPSPDSIRPKQLLKTKYQRR